jgi:amidohydrolase
VRTIFALLVCIACFSQTLEERVASKAAALEKSLIEQRRDFHVNPELSNREERTARVIAEKLRRWAWK